MAARLRRVSAKNNSPGQCGSFREALPL